MANSNLTLRKLLAIVAVVAVFCVVLSQAVRGSLWAAALSLGVGTAVLSLLVFAAMFCLAMLWTLIVVPHRRTTQARSPFAQDSPPPQHLKPQD
ncbi:MAG: hypothetical protein R3E01_06400 [Pirellulaceae bacterium]|nr:hypothetical protein [Planctomycetales bacterium]